MGYVLSQLVRAQVGSGAGVIVVDRGQQGAGIEPVFHHRFPGVAFAYLNSDRIGGAMFELIELKERSTALI